MNLAGVVGAQTRKPNGLLGRWMGLLMNWSHRPLSKWTIEQMKIQPDDFVLDIGCGGGMAIKEITKIATNGFVAGVDYSETMVKQALKHNAAAVCATRVEIRNGSISNLPFKDASFDKAYAIESFNFWPDPVAGLKEVHRVLKPTGSFYLHCDPTASHYLKLVLDQIFGVNNFRNEIAWCYRAGGILRKGYPSKHDILLFYTKGKEFTFNHEYIPYTEGTLQRGLTKVKGK